MKIENISNRTVQSTNSMHITEREDASTIRKTQHLSHHITSVIPSKQPMTQSVTTPLNFENGKEIEKELIEIKKNPPNYLIRLQEIIGKNLEQIARSSEKEKLSIDEQKKLFKTYNKEWGSLVEEIGNRGFNFTLIALGLLVFQLPAICPFKTDREFMSFLSKDGCQAISNMMNSTTQSKQKAAEGLASLAMAEINAKINKGSSEASAKQELVSLLEKAFELLKRAAQAG